MAAIKSAYDLRLRFVALHGLVLMDWFHGAINQGVY